MRIVGIAVAEKDDCSLLTLTAEVSSDIDVMDRIQALASRLGEGFDADPKPATRSRSRRSSSNDEAGGDTPKTTRRRRGSASASEESGDAEPKTTRSRRGGGTKEAGETSTRSRRSASGEEAAEDKPKRRTRRSKSPDEISDDDVTKAASEAAEKVSPEVVSQILDEDFGTDNVFDLDQEQRKKFLETLQVEMSNDDDEIPF